jgi:hypothetical protein
MGRRFAFRGCRLVHPLPLSRYWALLPSMASIHLSLNRTRCATLLIGTVAGRRASLCLQGEACPFGLPPSGSAESRLIFTKAETSEPRTMVAPLAGHGS